MGEVLIHLKDVTEVTGDEKAADKEGKGWDQWLTVDSRVDKKGKKEAVSGVCFPLLCFALLCVSFLRLFLIDLCFLFLLSLLCLSQQIRVRIVYKSRNTKIDEAEAALSKIKSTNLVEMKQQAQVLLASPSLSLSLSISFSSPNSLFLFFVLSISPSPPPLL
jgi:hypothetical protein